MAFVNICKVVLGPVLLVQGRHTKRHAMRMAEPEGERQGNIVVEDCPGELKLLFVGDSTMAGVGVTQQENGLAALTAAAVSERLDRSVRWQMVAQSGITTSEVLQLTQAEPLLTPDVLITALGANDVMAQTRPRAFVAAYASLIDGLLPGAGPHRAVINGLPPLHMTPAVPQPLRWFFGRYARMLERRLQRWVATQDHVSYLPLVWAADKTRLAEDRFHPGEGLYREWAALIAEQVSQLFLDDRPVEHVSAAA